MKTVLSQIWLLPITQAHILATDADPQSCAVKQFSTVHVGKCLLNPKLKVSLTGLVPQERKLFLLAKKKVILTSGRRCFWPFINI